MRAAETPMATAGAVDPTETADAAPTLLTRAALEGTAGQRIEGCALVVRCDVGQDRLGQPYLSLTLRGDDRGRFEARWWRYPYPAERRPVVGQVCWFGGTIERYGGEPQLKIERARPAEMGLEHFAPAAARSLAEIESELERRLDALAPDLAALARGVLAGEVYERFRVWPAAQHHHGAVRHGLLAHSLRVAAIAECLGTVYGAQGLPHDADLVAAACLLHDVGKVYTLPEVAGGPVSPAAAQADHTIVGALLIARAAEHLDRPLEPDHLDALLHAILAHHGRREWGAPVEPQTVEAWLVHLADLAESRLWRWSWEGME